LNFANVFESGKSKGVKGKELLRFSGAIKKSDLSIMELAIEEGCEKVNVKNFNTRYYLWPYSDFTRISIQDSNI